LHALEASQLVGQSVDLLVAANGFQNDEPIRRRRILADLVQAEPRANVLAVLAQNGLNLASVGGAVGDVDAYNSMVGGLSWLRRLF
jgi:hypothetical protein